MPLPSGLPEDVDDQEPITRFLTRSKHSNTNGVTYHAYMPNPTDNRTSVCRVAPEDREEVMDCIIHFFPDGREVYGTGTITAKDIRALELEVEALEPPPRHADIYRWPWLENDKKLAKSRQTDIAKQLAARAKHNKF